MEDLAADDGKEAGLPAIGEVFVEDSEDERKKKAAKKKTGTTDAKSSAAALSGSGGKTTNPIEDVANAAVEAFQLDEDELIGANSSPAKRGKPTIAKGVTAFLPDTTY